MRGRFFASFYGTPLFSMKPENIMRLSSSMNMSKNLSKTLRTITAYDNLFLATSNIHNIGMSSSMLSVEETDSEIEEITKLNLQKYPNLFESTILCLLTRATMMGSMDVCLQRKEIKQPNEKRTT